MEKFQITECGYEGEKQTEEGGPKKMIVNPKIGHFYFALT